MLAVGIPRAKHSNGMADNGSGGAAAAIQSVAAFVVGFAPWIVYWVLVGNTPFLTAVLVPLLLSVLINGIALARHQPLMVLEAGTAVVFAVFVLMSLTLSDDFLERWLQPLGNAGLFLIVLISILIGKPFTLQYARKSTPRELWDEPGFVYVCWLLAWVWAAAMAFMTIVSLIPPIVDGDATVRDADDTLSVVCYWVLPFAALGLAMVFTSKYPDWFVEASGDDGNDPTPRSLEPPQAISVPTDDEGAPVVQLEPADVLANETATVQVTGVAPGATVTVSAETVDAFGHRWRSTTTARADGSGALQLADPDKLVWSMEFESAGATPDLFIPPFGPAPTIVLAEAAGKHGHGTLVRRAAAPDLDTQEVRAPGVVGRLFMPPATEPVPGVVLFPGSEGGLDSQTSNAELLASHGCAALVAAPFVGDGPPLDGLPSQLDRVPLERFADAIRWLAADERVDAARVSAMAISRGSEGLLATAARVNDLPLASIVAVSPSSATWVGLGEHGSLVGIPAWTLGGEDLPAVQTDDRAVLSEIARQALHRRGRAARFGPALLHLTRAYAPRLDDPEATGTAAIEAERIGVPLLLVAGEADTVWPSSEMARRLLDRRRQAGTRSAANDQLRTYPDAGHLIRLGCWPTTVTHTGSIELGGTAAGLAAAQADVTRRIIAFVTTPAGA